MAKQQTRRSISVSYEVYAKLKLWCEVNNRSMSSVVEESLSHHLLLDRKDKIRERANATRPIEKGGNVFTF